MNDEGIIHAKELQIGNMPDDKLLEEYHATKVLLDYNRQQLHLLEAAMHRRMTERGAIGLQSERFQLEVKNQYDYQQPLLAPLLEIFTETDIKACYVPEHIVEKTILADWDLVKTKPLAKRYGSEALNIVDSARYIKSRRLALKERKA